MPPKKIYQFKITLKETHPPVWRRVQVPSTYTFWDLHVAIQGAMGWSDCHPHKFRIISKSVDILVLGTPLSIHKKWLNVDPRQTAFDSVALFIS
jgi:hypothetical protein